MNRTLSLYIIFIVLFGLYIHDLMATETYSKLQLFSSISQYLSLALLLFLILYLFFKSKPSCKDISPVRGLKTLIISSFLIIVFWSISTPLGSLSTYIRHILPYFVLQFSYTIVQKFENFKLYYILNSVLLIILLFTYFESYHKVLLYYKLDENVSDGSYFLLYLLPVFLCTKKKVVALVAVLIVFIAIVISAKRGGLIAFSFGLLLYLIVNVIVGTNEKYFILRCIAFTVFISIAGFIITDFIENGDMLISRRLMEISDTGGSGRDIVWKNTWDLITGSDLPGYIFGYGYNQVLKDSPVQLSAHNDFLEIIYDYGLIIFTIYIIFQIQLIRRIYIMIKDNSKYAGPLVFSYATFLVNSMVSHIFIYPQYFVIYTFVWGSILGFYHKEQMTKFSEKYNIYEDRHNYLF